MDEVLLEVSERTAPAAEVVFGCREEDVTVLNTAETRADGGGAVGRAERVRAMDGGAAGFGGGEAVMALGAGFPQDKKKPSSSAPAEGCAANLYVSTPSTVIPFGNLYMDTLGFTWPITISTWLTGLHPPSRGARTLLCIAWPRGLSISF